MTKIKKNNFLFIMLISIATLILLIVGALTLYKDNSKTFASEGYIIETTTKANKKYYFNGNTKYKSNVDKKISFSDTNSKEVLVDPASFVHYLNGNITFLQRGAIVNLADIKSPMVPYYNITSDTTVVKENDNYSVTSNNKKINIDNFVGRINDKKYIIAGNNISLKIPTKEDRIEGEYFEITYVEEGIVKIDNMEASYQVTAQDSYVYVGDNITISLGDGKIFYDGDVKMLLSQITINGDENIDLDVDKQDGTGLNGTGGGGSEGSGGEGTGDSGTGTEDGIGLGGEGTEDGNGLNGTGTEAESKKTTDSPQIELIEAKVTATTIDISMQLNNAERAMGNIVAYLTNVQTGERVYAKSIDLVNGTFVVAKESLSPTTEYALNILETGENEKQYFQKIFKTKDLGLTLEKAYATENSLAYKIIFDENSDVTKARITIYDNNGSNLTIYPNEFTVNSNDADTSVVFENLKSNNSYSVSIDTVWINNAAYSNVYTINRIDSTLKATPSISGVVVETNTEEVKFTIKLNKITDKDKSIISYIYNFYRATDVTLENEEPEVIYSVVKNDSDALVVDLSQIDELKPGVDYRCKIIAQYNDNEMIREVSTDYSNNFLIKSKPNISWELASATWEAVSGTLTLIDASCSVPISGRTCNSANNNFTLRYYKLSDGETNANDMTITFNKDTLKSNINLIGLQQNTTYAMKVYGNYTDENGVHEGVQIGDAIYITTDKSPELRLEKLGNNKSGYNKDGTPNRNNVVTFDAKLVPPQDKKDIYEEIGSITLRLYSGRFNTADKLLGTYTITSATEIEKFFSQGLTITNNIFTTRTGTQLDTIEKLIAITNNSTNTLNKSYTVEVEDVYDINHANKLKVDDNVITFDLTPAYYLDARIDVDTKNDPNKRYITVTPIKKESLTEEEYNELKRTITNLDDLNNDTVVGVIVENTLSDIFVDSAYKYEDVYDYEKVDVVFTIENIGNSKLVKSITNNTFGNKYQPKSQVIYIDPSDLDNGNNFNRGYNYKFGYELHFTTEDGENPVYKNDKLYKNLVIEKQAPIYTQYISTSNSTGITYRYSFTDIDKAISNKNFYYQKGDSSDYVEITNAINNDGNYHTVTLEFDEDSDYKFYYAKKGISKPVDYIEIDKYKFEKEITYNNEESYELLNNYNNNLTIKLLNNKYTERAAAYKVVIKSDGQTDYVRYFLASRLKTLTEETGEYDDEDNPITTKYKYIAIDYANISNFMTRSTKVYVYSYYDNGLVGLDQEFNQGTILKKKDNGTEKYLNIHNNGNSNANANTSLVESSEIVGINFLKTPHNIGDPTISLYNKIMNTANYDPIIGATYYDTNELSDKIGIKYNVSFTEKGILLNYNSKDYTGYNARVLNEANLKSDNNNYKFDEIIPTIDVRTNSTINSIKVNINPSGIYGGNQFKKDNAVHNKVYIDFYSDKELTNKLTTNPIVSDVHITESSTGYSATIDSFEYQNLIPATDYYFTVYAYINNRYTQLFDSSSRGSYITKTYNAKTLTDEGILNRLYFSVAADKYDGSVSRKNLGWQIDLKNTENYKLRFELYAKNGEEYDKQVKFDGTAASSCNINTNGTSSDGYVSNCYISVPQEEIDSIKSYSRNNYKFSGNSFVFGDNYYKLVIYAIPYTNNSFDEAHKLKLYENILKNTPEGTTARIEGKTYTENIILRPQQDPTLSINNTLDSGYDCPSGWSNEGQCSTPGSGYYYITFVPTATDPYYVIKNGKYKVIIKDFDGNIINSGNDEKCYFYFGTNKNDVKSADNCVVEVDANSIEQLTFIRLASGTVYNVELQSENYLNNADLTETEKNTTTKSASEFIETPPAEAFIALTSTVADKVSSSVLTITHNGSRNLTTNILKVIYTISGNGEMANGEYSIQRKGDTIFTIGADKTRRLTIDLSESDNPSFTLKPGNSYAIRTQYTYCKSFESNGTCKEENKYLLYDVTNFRSTTFTTILN